MQIILILLRASLVPQRVIDNGSLDTALLHGECLVNIHEHAHLPCRYVSACWVGTPPALLGAA